MAREVLFAAEQSARRVGGEICRLTIKSKFKRKFKKELNQAKSEEFLADETIRDSRKLAFRGGQFRDCFKENCLYRGI